MSYTEEQFIKYYGNSCDVSNIRSQAYMELLLMICEKPYLIGYCSNPCAFMESTAVGKDRS